MLGSSPAVEDIYNAITYSVYLKNSVNGNVIYVTTNPEEFGERQATIPRGQFAQKTIQTAAPAGYDQLCIVINGRNECGFGRVSTGLGLQIVSDAIAKDDALNRNIDSADECAPSSGTLPSSLRSVPTAEEYGLLSSGVSRVCSLNAPEGGENRWHKVGTCGRDANGIDLGLCWIDTESIKINDVQSKKGVLKNLSASERETIKSSDALEALKQLNDIRNRIVQELLNAFNEYKVKNEN